MVKDIWVPNPISTPDRPKRGGEAAVVGVGIAAVAAVMFSQIYSQNELTSLISQTQKQTEKHIKTLADSISINSDNILELNRTFSLLQNNSVNEFVKIQEMQTITSMSMTRIRFRSYPRWPCHVESTQIKSSSDSPEPFTTTSSGITIYSMGI